MEGWVWGGGWRSFFPGPRVTLVDGEARTPALQQAPAVPPWGRLLSPCASSAVLTEAESTEDSLSVNVGLGPCPAEARRQQLRETWEVELRGCVVGPGGAAETGAGALACAWPQRSVLCRHHNADARLLLPTSQAAGRRRGTPSPASAAPAQLRPRAGKQPADPQVGEGQGVGPAGTLLLPFLRSYRDLFPLRSCHSPAASHPGPHVWRAWRGSSVPYRLLAGRDLACICALSKGKDRQVSVFSGRP